MTMKLTMRNCLALALALATFVQADPISLVTTGSVSTNAIANVAGLLRPEAQRASRGDLENGNTTGGTSDE